LVNGTGRYDLGVIIWSIILKWITGIGYEDVKWNYLSIVADDIAELSFLMTSGDLFGRSEVSCSVMFPAQYTVLIL
jgi:hypothetical protein